MNEVLTIVIPLIVYIITSIIGYQLLLKTIDKRFQLITDLFLKVIDERIQLAIDGVGEALGEVLKPLTTLGERGMTLLGQNSGKVRGDNVMMEKIATDVLSGPKLAAIKAAAKMGLGIDIDSYIEEDGAVKTLENIQGLASLIGIDIGQVLAGGLNGANLSVGHEANNNPYRS